MKTSWDEAARRYHDATRRKLEEAGAQEEVRGSCETERARKATELASARAIATAALTEFLASSEGAEALTLLEASNRHIVFGEEREGGGYGVVYYLDEHGPCQSIEAMGEWVVYASPGQVKEPRIAGCSIAQLIEAAIDPRMGNKKPEEVLPWLRGELDRIAAEAP